MRRACLALLALQFFPLWARGSAPKQPSAFQRKLHARVKTYSVRAQNFVQALAAIATKFQIPMGIQWTEDAGTNREVSRSWSNASAQQIIESIVNSHPGYEFDVRDGVVHIFPEWAKSSRQDFANLMIQNFVVRDQAPEAASKRLRELVRLTVSPPVARTKGPVGSAHSQAADVGERGISLALEHATVRDVLDKIALRSDRKIWIITFTKGPLTTTGFRRTRTLWVSTVPADEQPVWDMLRWGDPTPTCK